MNESSIIFDKGKKYVLYISTAQANEMVDRQLEKENQSLVYSLGITSKNIYFDVENGIKINEYSPNPSLDLKKRYYLWRIYVFLQWYNVALVKHYRGEGKIHHYNFMDVAIHFLRNACEAYDEFMKL